MLGIAKKIFGSSNDRKVKDFMGRVQKINALEDKFAAPQVLMLPSGKHHLVNEAPELRARYFDFLRERLA